MVMPDHSCSVSVIIPAYNVASYIRETLDSVFAQTFANLEVILVNDGSPDTTELERAIEPYRQRIIYLKQDNRGAAAARNHGLHAAKGEFVAFLDGDDLWNPTFLDEQLSFLRANSYDLVYADALMIGDSALAGRTFMQDAPSEGEVTVTNLLLAKVNVITSGVVARLKPIIEAGLFDEGLRNSHDFDLWVRLAKRGLRLGYQRKVLLSYRCREGSLSGDSVNNVVRQLRVYDKIQHAYDLTWEERSAVSQMLVNLRAEFQLESGKQALLHRDFSAAAAHFKEANSHYRSRKLALVVALTKVCPNLLVQVFSQSQRRRKTILTNIVQNSLIRSGVQSD